MKRLLKIAGIIIGVLFLIFLLFVGYIQWGPFPVYENQATEISYTFDSLDVEKGARIATMTCAGCHMSSDGKFGGMYMKDNDSFGKIYAPNITQHPGKSKLSHYTDGELVYLFRTGIKKDGSYAPPWMPKYPHMSDEDMKSLIAFLRSDHPLLEPSENMMPPTEYKFITKLLVKMKVFSPLPYPEVKIPHPDLDDQVALGKYLSTAVYDCYGCHSPDFKTLDVMEPEKTPGYFSGGNPFLDDEGNPILTANLTFDEKTGIGTWTKAQFIRNVKFGIKPDGSGSNRYPMPPFSLLTDEEAGAIYEYLKSIPKIENEVNRHNHSEI